MLVSNRLMLLVLGMAYVLMAAAGAFKGRPALSLFYVGLIGAVAIAYSTLQRLPPWLQRVLGIGANSAILFVVLQALLLSWHDEGPSVSVPLLALVVLLLFGVPLLQLIRGTTPPAVWKGRA